jgi:hypothetical protein
LGVVWGKRERRAPALKRNSWHNWEAE